MKPENKTALWRIAAAGCLILMNGLAMILFRKYPGFFFPAYRQVSGAWISFLAWLTSFSPLAVWDILLSVMTVIAPAAFIHSLVKHRVLSWFSRILFAGSVLLTMTVSGWMLNHYAPPLADELGYQKEKQSTEVLYEACEYFLVQAGDYARLVSRQKNGSLTALDFYPLAEKAGRLYEALSDTSSVFQGSSVRVKKLSVVGEYLMYSGVIGMFMPVTGEAGVPASVPAASMPFTMAHEAAHRLGIASEEEANFAAFLACMESDDPVFLYSGTYSAFSYCLSSLYAVRPDLCEKLISSHKGPAGIALLFLDRSDTASIYQRYESGLKEINDQINDTYLKTFSEESGIQSYGEVTDDLIAWYLKHAGQ